MAKRWTHEEDQLIIKLRSEGFTAREMTLRLNRTEAAIQARIRSLNLSLVNKPWTEEEKLLVLELKREGHTNKYIARQVDRTPRAVGAFLIRHWNNPAVEP